MRLEFDFPYAGESFPLGDLSDFVDQAYAGGADSTTPVVAATSPQDDAIVEWLRVEFEPAARGDRTSGVRLARSDISRAVAVLEAIEENDGDARMQLAAVHELRKMLTQLAIG